MKVLKHDLGKLVLCLCELVIGILLFVDPVGFTSYIIRIAGVLLLVAGIVSLIRYFRMDPMDARFGHGLAVGILELAGGLFCLVRYSWFIATFPVLTILYGLVNLIGGVMKIQWTVDMIRCGKVTGKEKNWQLSAVSAAVSTVFAILILLNPFTTTEIVWGVVAVSLVLSSLLDIFAIFTRKQEKPETEEH